MDLYEYQGKSLFARVGVPVPEGRLAHTVAEAKAAAQELGGPVVIKAQVQVGGRGKAGGIKLAADHDEAASYAGDILGMDIKGHTVHRVWVERASDIKHEYYASFTLDRGAKKHLAMVSAQGGVDIEGVAATDPEAVVKVHIDPVMGLTDWQARQLVYQAKLDPAIARPAAATLRKLYQAFVDLDCDLVEVNPLIVTGDDQVVALDAKVTIDSNALYRHPDFAEFSETFVVDPIEKMATDRGLNFIKLDGSVGIMANGAGLAMATLDVVDLVGGAAANFLDVGGSADADAVTDALEVLTQDENVAAVLINIFGGIVRCDLVAEGIVEAMTRMELPWPLVVRLDGTNAAEARAILDEKAAGKIIPAATMREGAEKAVALAGPKVGVP
ncbi:MAG: ADP-forming succinate--CoA ligase subunit beta [Acidimicrobiia bacterium]